MRRPTLPNPGSPEAVDRGCTCAVIDNHYGRGFGPADRPEFWITISCPLHGLKETDDEDEDEEPAEAP